MIMQNQLYAAEFADNPDSRCPVSVILDSSSSMSIGGRIEKLSMALAKLKAELSDDTMASQRVELSLVTFNHEVEYVDFRSVEAFEPPDLQASGGTMVCPAVNTALDLLAGRKAAYREAGISYYRPLTVLLTDGRFEHDSDEDLAMIKQRLTAEEEGRHVAFFAFGTEAADIESMSKITPPNRPPRHIGGAENIAGVFQWLSNSVEQISRATPGDRLELDELDAYLSY